MSQDEKIPMVSYTPESLEAMGEAIKEIRRRAVFDTDMAGADHESEQFYQLAVNALYQSIYFLNLAAHKQTMAVGATGRWR